MQDRFTFVADPPAEQCNDLVLAHHYSRRLPNAAVVYRAGLADESGDLVAAVFFSHPPTMWSKPVKELSRLVRKPGCKPPLTGLIGKACRELKRRKLADLVVSFADATQGHHGGVYQAASWNYHDQRKPQNDGFIIDGEFVPRRTLNSRFGSSSRERIVAFCEVWGSSCVVHWDKGKHLYWRALTATGESWAHDLGFGCNPYPKDIA